LEMHAPSGPPTILQQAHAIIGCHKKKSRSKQKNMRKDTRPEHLKPSYRIALAKSGENRDNPWSLGVGKNGSVKEEASDDQSMARTTASGPAANPLSTNVELRRKRANKKQKKGY